MSVERIARAMALALNIPWSEESDEGDGWMLFPGEDEAFMTREIEGTTLQAVVIEDGDVQLKVLGTDQRMWLPGEVGELRTHWPMTNLDPDTLPKAVLHGIRAVLVGLAKVHPHAPMALEWLDQPAGGRLGPKDWLEARGG